MKENGATSAAKYQQWKKAEEMKAKYEESNARKRIRPLSMAMSKWHRNQ